MKIKVKDFWSKNVQTKSVSEFFIDELAASLETPEPSVSNIMRAFGKLIEKLTELGSLDIDDIKTISGVIDGIELVK